MTRISVEMATNSKGASQSVRELLMREGLRPALNVPLLRRETLAALRQFRKGYNMSYSFFDMVNHFKCVKGLGANH